MSDIKVTTNNHVRPLLTFAELSDAERAEFDYITPDSDDAWMDRFFRFRGDVWDINDFEVLRTAIANGGDTPLADAGWHAASGQSYFDAIVIRLAADKYGDDGVVVGHATW